MSLGATLNARTVQKHLQDVYDKLGATSRTQALLAAWSIDRTGPRPLAGG